MWQNRFFFFLSSLLLFITGCTSTRSISSLLQSIDKLSNNQFEIYFLDFNNNGELVSEEVAERAKRDLSQGRFDRVLILSLGWAYESDSARSQYLSLIEEYLSHIQGVQIKNSENSSRPSEGSPYVESKTAVFCITWSSSSQGISRFLADITPGQTIGTALGYVPDRLLFPITFWSKTSLAQDIGYRTLSECLSDTLVSEHQIDPPEIHMIGHSFGCRILCGLYRKINEGRDIKKRNALQNKMEAFRSRISNIILLQPAMSVLDLATSLPLDKLSSRVVITQTPYDHANNFLYPLANGLFPTYVSTEMNIWMLHQEAFKEFGSLYTFTGELMVVPGTVYNAFFFTPGSYVIGVTHQLCSTHINVIPNTLAQLPLLEIPVSIVDHILDGLSINSQHWGYANKGLLNMGPMTESIGSGNAQYLFWSPPLYKLDQIIKPHGPPANFLNPGIQLVDVSSVMHSGQLFGLIRYDMSNPIWDWTISWLDPVGSHSDFRKSEIYELIRLVIMSPLI